ncbi:MAG: branched-chain amino acid transport system ATP-binding protein [Actinomycetota bacterium]|jgi:ABC-type branched-subunit amino acid transport system ATPase component|nr:branched-chain amino acid transport system ATP-binding protein [Actinomycetota bacterium]
MTNLLDVEGVSVAFGGVQALDDVSISVPTGSVIGLIGPNGAGKTTLFNVISGLQRADRGRIIFAGNDISDLPTHRRAALGIGRSFQNLGLINDETVETNLIAAQHLASRYKAWQVLAQPWRVGGDERRMRSRAHEVASAIGLADRLAVQVGDLSFGMARFVELACVQVERPPLMLLDEPTTGLDGGETVRLLELLRSQAAIGTTILLVAHDVRFVMDLCDYVYVLAEGRVLSHGEPRAVQRDPLVIEAYLGRSA